MESETRRGFEVSAFFVCNVLIRNILFYPPLRGILGIDLSKNLSYTLKMEITTRQQAIDSGSKYFFTGKPCKRGHLTTRYVGNGGCVECLRPTMSTELAVISPTQIEILPVNRSNFQEYRERKMELERRRIELRELSMQLKAQQTSMRIESRHEHSAEKQIKVTVKTKLINIHLTISPEDYETTVNLVWAHAAMRDPRLRPEDIVVGSSPKEPLNYIMKCFPEDATAIRKFCSDNLSVRLHATISLEELIQVALTYEPEEPEPGPFPDWKA